MKDFDYCLSIVFGFAYCMLVLGLCQLLSWACKRVDDDHDHEHDGTSDDHVIITIKDLLTGINSSVLRSIPVVDFNSHYFKDVVHCVVCLSELGDGDKTRLLPTCKHWFHANCIDTWLQSNSTCPICRQIVSLVQNQEPRSQLSRFSNQIESSVVTHDANSGNPNSCDEHRIDGRRFW